MERTFRETSNGRISFLHRSGNFSLIFLHGLGGASNSWLRLANSLDGRLELYFLDLLGHGRTSATDWDYTVMGQARMVHEFIENSGIEQYGLVGNSYGGWISAAFSSRIATPDLLILEDSAGINPTIGEWDQERMEMFIDRLQGFGRHNDRDTMRRIMVQNSGDEEKLKESELASIRSRTMLVWGEHDQMIDISYGREMGRHISNSRFEIVKGAGHIPHHTHYGEIARLINGFIFPEPV